MSQPREAVSMCWGSSADAQASPPGSGHPCPLRQAAIGGVLRPRSWGSRRSGPFCRPPPPTHTGLLACKVSGRRWGHVPPPWSALGLGSGPGPRARGLRGCCRVAWAPPASGSCFSPRVGGPRRGAPAESACPAPLPHAPPRAGPASVAWQLWWPHVARPSVQSNGSDVTSSASASGGLVFSRARLPARCRQVGVARWSRWGRGVWGVRGSPGHRPGLKRGGGGCCLWGRVSPSAEGRVPTRRWLLCGISGPPRAPSVLTCLEC